MRTLQEADVWPVEAKLKAQKNLSSLFSDYGLGTYTLTDCFVEVSTRSRVTQLISRGLPTIAMREYGDFCLPLCALCVKPIGYDGQNWAGVMSPTDEVIAHLLMMRGSEEKFWDKSNQHPPEHPTA